jgi:hypothetical protein
VIDIRDFARQQREVGGAAARSSPTPAPPAARRKHHRTAEPAANDEGAPAAGRPPPGGRDEQRREQQKAENTRLQQPPEDSPPPEMSVQQMELDCVWIAEGSMVGRISDPQQVLSFTDFAGLTASSTSMQTEGGRVRPMPNAVLWKQSSCRQTVLTRTFHAGAGPICRDPDGKQALNAWRPIQRRPASADPAPFIDQVGYLFPELVEREAFLNWLAHLEQRPGELPHYGWLHIAEHTGTGRNWLASLLARVWRGYVAPNVDLPALLDSQFNGQLAGRILVIVDEVQEAAGENPYRHTNRLKSLVNAEYRDLNPKYGRQYREHNACRWLVFSNHENALPMNDTDRRWRVVKHEAAPREASVYVDLYARLADAEFVNAVGVYLQKRDIRAFNPGERPPMNQAKRGAVAASKTLIQRYAEQLTEKWPADVVTNADAAQVLSDGAETVITPAMRRALEELGAASMQKTIYAQGRTSRGWILRDRDRWQAASPSQLASEAARARPLGSGQATALELMDPAAADRPF